MLAKRVWRLMWEMPAKPVMLGGYEKLGFYAV